jgi:hypothetical protein
MGNEQRTKVWVDQFQTKLTLRIGAYLAVFLAVLFNFLLAWRLWVEGPGHFGEQCIRLLLDYMPVWICLLILVPVMAWDALRFSHRLVGPLVRFRRAIKDVAQGEPVHLIKLREGDYLIDLRDDVNEMLEALQRRGFPVLKPINPMTEDNSNRTSA